MTDLLTQHRPNVTTVLFLCILKWMWMKICTFARISEEVPQDFILSFFHKLTIHE